MNFANRALRIFTSNTLSNYYRGEKPPARAPYKVSPSHLEELRKQLEELLAIGHICPSHAPFGDPVLF
ncbi:unnamed protein product [Spirodela intermedia]|uniref:Uncharacterized protein n=1 Tax=Spirodela intermedia TaxID=51605 RepID=A0A7I8KHV2_SPIIN|nr:unnamed protein product [Spirodela intermedia]